MISKLIKSEKGQSAVEFALVLPLLLVILCGIIDMGWVYSNQYQVENAAYAGVRYAVINGADIDDADKNQLITDTKTRVESNLGTGVEATAVTVDIGTDNVTVNVKCQVKMLTFVGQQMFGEYYNADVKNVGAR